MTFSPKEQFEGFVTTSQIFNDDHSFEYPLYPAYRDSLPQDFPEISAPEASVLGKRMEHYFTCYVSHFTSEKVLAHNRQIIENRKTVGELDFLLKDSVSGQLTHVELVYKFYIFDPASGTSEIEHLIGPNKRDSLTQKLQRLQKNQFPLLFQRSSEKLLKNLKVDPQLVFQKMCFKASVFLPKQSHSISLQQINPAAVTGYWITAAEFFTEAYKESQFFIPAKRFWPIQPQKNRSWLSFEEIEQQVLKFLGNKYSPLLWMKTSQGNYERFFVVWC